MRLKLSRLKKNKVFMKHLRWDVTPQDLFKPRFVHSEKDRDLIKETQGFMFYIDYVDDTASLMVMKTYNLTSKTIGEIVDVPQELLLNAVKKEGVKPIADMYPIDEELEKWLKSQLDITA
jgi:hypothetical protein